MEQVQTVRGVSAFTGRHVEIKVSDDRITGVTELSASVQDRDLPFVAPGFIDIQVNGYQGRDFSSPSLSEEDALQVVRSLQPTGTTSFLPTIITNARKTSVQNIRTIRSVAQSEQASGAILGFHMEGPFISSQDGPRGAHDERYVRDPDITEYEDWQSAAEGTVRIVTLAPERSGALKFIERIVHDGVVAAIGHTIASESRIREAVAAGAHLSTHLGNGSPQTMHRFNNHIWPQLAHDGLTASIIADGYHLPPSVLTVFGRTKGVDHVILVSDVGPLAGFSPGVYSWGSLRIRVYPDGHLQIEGSEFLAGAGHLLDRCVAQYCRRFSLAEAVRAATINPARLLNLSDRTDGFVSRAVADLVLFRLPSECEALQVEQVIHRGRVVWER